LLSRRRAAHLPPDLKLLTRSGKKTAMRVLITGAAGEFGRDLVPWLAKSHDVRATDIAPTETPCEFVQATETPCEFVQADLRDPEQVKPLVEGIDAIVHLAVLLPFDYATADFVDVNTKASTLLCEAAAAAGVSRMVYISTVWATGHGTEEGYLPVDEEAPLRPQEMYGLTKLQGELSAEYYARTQGLSTLVLRMCGYQRCPEFAPDGTIDLDTADLVAVADSMLRPGQKLYSPTDLGAVMQAAVTVEGVDFERMIVGNHVPWQAADIENLKADPLAVAEKYCPGIAELYAANEAQLAPVGFFYTVEKLQRILGLKHEYTPADVIAAHQRRG